MNNKKITFIMLLLLNIILYLIWSIILGWFPLFRIIRIMEQREGFIGVLITLGVVVFFEIASYIMLSAMDCTYGHIKIQNDGESKSNN